MEASIYLLVGVIFGSLLSGFYAYATRNVATKEYLKELIEDLKNSRKQRNDCKIK